jgi:hypothetical protein
MSCRIPPELDGGPAPSWMGTFQGLAAGQLRIEPEVAGLRPGFDILDADDRRRIVRRTLKALNLPAETAAGEWPRSAEAHLRPPVQIQGQPDHARRGSCPGRSAGRAAVHLISLAEYDLRLTELCRIRDFYQDDESDADIRAVICVARPWGTPVRFPR